MIEATEMPWQVTRIGYEVWYFGKHGGWNWACSKVTEADAVKEAEYYKARGCRSIVAKAQRTPVFDTGR